MSRTLLFGILSFSLDSFSVRRLRQAMNARSFQSKLIDAAQCSLECTPSGLGAFVQQKPMPDCHIYLPRLGAGSPAEGIDIVRHLELSGKCVLNPSAAIAKAREKFLTMQVLSAANLPVPPSCMITHSAGIRSAIERLGGAPVIIKINRGSQGIGVMLAESVKAAEAIYETMQLKETPVLIQKCINESKGRDIRAFVVGNKVVASMRRIAQGDEFRSNFHRGGRVEAVELDSQTQAIAIGGANALGLRVAGVDILEGSGGPLIMELNSSPGLEGIESATNIDVAGAVIEYAQHLYSGKA